MIIIIEETSDGRLFAYMSNTQWSPFWAGILVTLCGAILFSAKAVLAKMIYRGADISVVSLLVLRMLFSLPFYIAMLLYTLPGYKQRVAGEKTQRHALLKTMAIGMLGYYVSSYFDFTGLKYISASLERIILFIYPTFTILFALLLFKSKIGRYQWLALLVSYAGVFAAFAGDVQQGHSHNLVLGSLFVFACAITYALYVLLSGRLVQTLGVGFFTSLAMISATIAVLLHFLIAGENVSTLQHLPFRMYMLILAMAIFTTVLPSYLLSAGLKRIGSSNVAIISSIGPMATIVQAYLFLGESFGWLQALGTLLVIAGVGIIGMNAKK